VITGGPRPLPECRDCKTPVRRHNWTDNGGKCSDCMTPEDHIARAHRRAAMQRLAEGNTTPRQRTQARIDQLAAKRQAREALRGGTP
jgi:hypothetical protein